MPNSRNKSARANWQQALCAGLALLFTAVVHADESGTATGDPNVLLKQASRYLHGRGVEADVERAIELYRAVAERDIAFAQYRLARIYLDREHVARDIDEALAWLHRAAGLGFVEAQLALSRLYESGDGVEADYVSAWKWLHIAESLSERDFEERKQALQEKMSFWQNTRARYLARRCIYRRYKNC